MTSLDVVWKEVNSKPSLYGTVVLAALLLSVLVIVLAPHLFQSKPKWVHGQPSVVTVPTSVLIAATKGGANALTAVGERAELINASLPFDNGPIEPAQPFQVDADAANYPRALLCLRAAIYHEAGFEPLAGRRAVAQVILNRVRHPAYPQSVCEVVYQGAGSPVCQFSFACDEARHRPVAANAWQDAMQVASEALAGYVEPSVGTATHYHADYVAPRWAPLLTKVGQTGTHIFYRWPGSWGERPAFLRRYHGEEASPIGRAMELEAATSAAMQITGARGIQLLGVSGGSIASAVVRGDLGRGPATKAERLWNVGTHEDLVAATLAGRLVEHGVVYWDTPMSQLFPDLVAYMGSKLQAITFSQLLFTPSVFPPKPHPDFLVTVALGADQLTVQRATFLNNEVIALGTGRHESRRSPHLTIVAAAMEGVTGLPYEQLVKNEVFHPLGLRTASFMPRQASSARMAVARPVERTRPLSQAGQLQISLKDFSAFLIDQMKGAIGQGRLLSVANYRRLHQIGSEEQTRQGSGDCAPRSLGSALRRQATYWIAGVNTGADQKKLIVTDIPAGRNRLAAFTHNLKISQARTASSRTSLDRSRCPAGPYGLPV